MFNQIRRIWADNGSGDKDFTPQEEQLKRALEHLQQAADSLSRASEALLDVINKGN
jgi:predicted HTH domain antitoxin